VDNYGDSSLAIPLVNRHFMTEKDKENKICGQLDTKYLRFFGPDKFVRSVSK